MLIKKNKGFTLLEMVIAMAIFSICLAMSFGIISYALAQKAANVRILAIQNSFSTAGATITDEIKGAIWPDQMVGGDPNAFLLAPEDGAITNELIFLTGTAGEEYRIRYFAATNAKGTRIYKEKASVLSTTDPSVFSLIATDPVTPYMNQTINLNFVNSKGKITILMVAKLKINGEENDISFIGTAYARNYVALPQEVEGSNP